MRYLDVNFKIMFGFLNEISAVVPVCVNSFYPWKRYDEQSHQSVCRSGFVNIGRDCGCLQYIAVLVRYDIEFHVFGLLVAVNALLRARQGGARTLTVNGTNRGVGCFSSSEPDFLHKPVLKFGKRSHSTPASEIVIHCLPFGIFCRQQAPLACADIYVDYRVKNEKKSYLLRQVSMRNFPLDTPSEHPTDAHFSFTFVFK